MFSSWFRPLLAVVILACPLGSAKPDPAAPGTPAQSPTPDILEKLRTDFQLSDTEYWKRQPGVPHGELIEGSISDSPIYPGTENGYQIYVPAQYDPATPACLVIRTDGIRKGEDIVLDNLIAKKEMPVAIEVGIVPGVIWKDAADVKARAAYRRNRSYEFDSVNGNLDDYVLNELLPEIEKRTTRDGRPIRISPSGNDHAIVGTSTGGIAAFTMAWQRPDAFNKVYSMIGTFVSMRGGDQYPSLIRKTEPKAIRVFLEDGSVDAWNPLFGNWFMANQNMAAALTFAGCDVQYVWGKHAHNPKPGENIFPDVMRWLWKGWPSPVKAGQSNNNMLKEILIPGEEWREVGNGYTSAAGLASNQKGEVCFSDGPGHVIYKIGTDGKINPFRQRVPAISQEAFGPDGALYGIVPEERRIVALDAGGAERTIAKEVRGHGIVVTSENNIYFTEPGEHGDDPSRVWLIKAGGGGKQLLDSGLLSASGLAFSPDRYLLAVAEENTQWIYSFLVEPDGLLKDKERFYWLHVTDIPNNSGAGDLAVDTAANLYAATRMGIQVCDRNGRVRAILPLPTPSGPVRGICFGGAMFDTLFATDGRKIFARKMKSVGYSQWAAPLSILPPIPSG